MIRQKRPGGLSPTVPATNLTHSGSLDANLRFKSTTWGYRCSSVCSEHRTNNCARMVMPSQRSLRLVNRYNRKRAQDMPREWRDHPKLRGRFHPEYPDDVQVIVHDGGPRLTNHRPELIWVRITHWDGSLFHGTVLNQPEQLSSVLQGSEIQFLVPDGGEHPLMVTDKYLGERAFWIIQPCDKCGLSELFDAPSDLLRVVFRGAPPDSMMEMFTAFCGACGGVQLVQHRDAQLEEDSLEQQEKKWWKFWK